MIVIPSIFKALSLAVTIAVTMIVSLLTHASEQPNVIVIVADDLGWADVGFHGGDIDTPSLDRIAGEGMQLDRFYTAPICSPTRAALMTGRNPMRLGVAYATIKPWDSFGVHPDEHFMPQSFLAAGYQTAMIGKWHLGHAQQTYHPNERGFEYFFGHLHTEVGYYPPFSNQGGKDFQRNGISIQFQGSREEGYETFLLADEASRYIRERDKTRPFFLYMPFIAPHTPLDAPEALQKKYKNINTDLESPRTGIADKTRRMASLTFRPSARPMYAAVVDAMDQAIGQVLATLDEQGIADNTLVLFLSDNGGATYSGGGADNTPLRGGKGETFEGGIRVVATMRWPGKIPSGKKMNQIMSVMDVLPTLAEATGVKLQNTFKLDGKSLWPAIADGKESYRDEYLFFVSESPIHGHFNLTIFNEEWKLVQMIDQDQLSTQIENQLYRISEDPYEYNNLAVSYPQVVAGLSERIHQWRARYPMHGIRSYLVPPPGWRAPLDWAEYPIPLDQLQPQADSGIFPEHAAKTLDQRHGERGRLIYGCDAEWWQSVPCKSPR